MAKNTYERIYYLIGPYDTVYGRYPKLNQAKARILEMSKNGARVHELKPNIYKSCEKPMDEYERSNLKYIENDGVWVYLYYTWAQYVFDILKDANTRWFPV